MTISPKEAQEIANKMPEPLPVYQDESGQIVITALRPMIEAKDYGEVLAYHKGGISSRGEPEPVPMIVEYDVGKDKYYWNEDDGHFSADQFHGFILLPIYQPNKPEE